MVRVGRWLPVVAVVTLLGGAMLAAAFGNPTIETVPPEAALVTAAPQARPTISFDLPTAPPTASPDAVPEDQTLLPAWVGWLLSGGCGLALLVVLTVLAWMTLRERLAWRRAELLAHTPPPTLAQTQQKVRAVIDEGLAELDRVGADPRGVVIACWVRLEAAAAAAGTPRHVGDTSTDLVARLLAEHMVSAEVLAGFAAVYREARYATHTVDETMRELALSALRQLRDELSVSIR